MILSTFKKISLKNIALFGAILLAAVLRIWGIDSGLPYVPIHIDEVTLVYTALSLVPQKGVLWFIGAGFFIPDYLFLLYSTYFVLGKIIGIFTTPESFLIAYLNDPSMLILLGRSVTVFWGVATVCAVYQIGKRWFSVRIGLLAAWFLSAAFLHVKESHYVKGDVLGGLVAVLIFHIACKVAKRGKLRDYSAGGIFAGIAFGVKYFPVLAAIMLFAAHFLNNGFSFRRGRLKIFFLVIIAIFVIFLQAPLTFIFRRDAFGEFLMWGQFVSSSPTFAGSVALTFISNHLRGGLGAPMMVAAVWGIALAIFNFKKFQYLLLLVFIIFFLGSAEFWARYNIPRYAIVIVPFFVLFAAVGVDFVVRFLPFSKLGKFATITLAIVIMMPTFVRSMKFDSYMNSPDTRALAKSWVEQNVADGAKIVNVGSLKPYVLGGGASLFLSSEATQREIDRAVSLGLPATYLKALLNVNSQRLGYDIYSTPSIIWSYDIETREHKELRDVTFYRDNGYQFIVTDSWAHPTAGEEFLKSLEEWYEEIVEFKPTVDFSYGPHDTVIEYDKVDAISFLNRGSVSGPTVKVYKLRLERKTI